MIDLLVDALATYRLTRLAVVDTFPPVKALRERIVEQHTRQWPDGEGGYNVEPDWLAELIGCPYCSSVWLAFGVVAARALFPKQWKPVATALAFAAVAGKAVDVLDPD